MVNNDHPTDQELVQRALQEPAEFSKIFDRYYIPLFRYIRRLGCRNNGDAEDILQETFISTFVNLNDYDAGLKFSSWIYRIAHNKAISYFRKQRVRPQVAETEELLLFMELVADDTNLAVNAERKYLQNEIRKALEWLDAKYRDPLVLKFLEDKSYEEISDILRIPVGTVGTLIKRGKQKLKEIINERNLK